MPVSETNKTLVQCDFDGTITEEDVSIKLLRVFADGNWRPLLQEYQQGKMSVGHFNATAFAMIKADRESLVKVATDGVKIRAGFPEMVACCRQRGFRLVIVSNGLDFYIEEILQGIGLRDIEVFAARTDFLPDGLKVQYIGPDGNSLDNNFKGAYVSAFLQEGYRVIYAGNGPSDFLPAKQCHHIFATGTLLTRCRETNLKCTPFTDFSQVVRVLELL